MWLVVGGQFGGDGGACKTQHGFGPCSATRIGQERNTLTPALPLRGRGRRGFTLMELILVMMILGLSAMIAVPSLAPFSRGRKLNDTAGQLLALTRFAQDKAMAEGASVRLTVDAAAGVFAVQMDGADGYQALTSGVAKSFGVGDGVTLAWEGYSEAATQGYIQFDADGGHDVATLRISGNDGGVLYLGTSGPTDGFRIVSTLDGGGG
jgi:type II secretion system protein H